MTLEQVQLPHEDVLQRRFHLVTGKGGVGKSAVSLALGSTFAQRGLRTLICEMNERETMAQLLGTPPSRGQLSRLDDQLYSVSINTQAALTEYGALKLKLKSLSTLLSENPLTRSLIALIPGVADLIALGKAFNHERERDTSGSPCWDRVIVDAPSTGHGLTMIRLPQLISEVVPRGNIRDEADAMWALIGDDQRCAIHVVTLPEELPLSETVELWQALEGELRLQPQALWVNQRLGPPIDEVTWEALTALSHRKDSNSQHDQAAIDLLISSLEQRRRAALNQAQYLHILTPLNIPSRASIPAFNLSLHSEPQALGVALRSLCS